MAFNARVLAPWAPVFADFNTFDEYCEWTTQVTGEPVDANTADWVRIWMNTASPYDILWLDSESRPSLPEKAEIQLMRN
jgi:hypothetical protein